MNRLDTLFELAMRIFIFAMIVSVSIIMLLATIDVAIDVVFGR